MSSYQGSITVSAEAKAIFDFVSNPENLPLYVPHIQRADHGHGDVIHISGECPHGAFRGVGGFSVDAEQMKMHWDSRANLNYRGWLHITDHSDHCVVTAHLEFDPGLDREANQEFSHVLRDHPKSMQQAVESALASIKKHCEEVLAEV
jgi:hypothetical protein